jgi:hypothetical protein
MGAVEAMPRPRRQGAGTLSDGLLIR